MGLLRWIRKRREWFKWRRDLQDKKVCIEYGPRGEDLEYKVGSNTLGISLTWCNGERLYTETINKWNDGTKLSVDERKDVFVNTLKFLNGTSGSTIVVINIDDESCSLWRELSIQYQDLVKAVEYWSNEQQREFEREMHIEIINSKASLTIDGTPIESVEHLDEVMKGIRGKK